MNNKPIGRKAYGSIPHLPGSRLGPADHHCQQGQQDICWVRTRDRHDRVIVTEKLDGSCCAIARVGDQVLALGRAGHLAQTSRYEQHQLFAHWVRAREDQFRRALMDGQRFVGEWMAQAHGSRYDLPHDPFVVFDVMVGADRLSHDAMTALADQARLTRAAVLHDGAAIGLEDVQTMIATSRHGCIGPVEGAVWRVDRRGKFDFLAKWVRPGKVDGSLLPEISGGDPVWNWRP